MNKFVSLFFIFTFTLTAFIFVSCTNLDEGNVSGSTGYSVLR